MSKALNSEQVDRLLADRTSVARTDTAARVAELFSAGELSDGERAIAVDLMEILARDIEQEVREALSEHVKHCPFLPPSIAATLVSDIESVSLPMIEFSRVLDDDRLIGIARNGTAAKQTAVAKRSTVPAIIADALVESGGKATVKTLLANPGADLTDRSLNVVIDKHGQDESVQALIVDRPTLTLAVSMRLIAIVSTELQAHLVERHDIPPLIADQLAMHGRERALTQVFKSGGSGSDLMLFVAELHANGSLTPTFVLRAICVADLDLFEACMATMTNVSIENVRALIYEPGSGGLRGLYAETGLPENLYAPIRVAALAVKTARKSNPNLWRVEFTEKLIDRLVREFDEVCPEDLEHVLGQLAQLYGPGSVSKK
jgi:uncharacterized protein (DUF2336 family)